MLKAPAVLAALEQVTSNVVGDAPGDDFAVGGLVH
jgi:hypothetical protein